MINIWIKKRVLLDLEARIMNLFQGRIFNNFKELTLRTDVVRKALQLDDNVIVTYFTKSDVCRTKYVPRIFVDKVSVNICEPDEIKAKMFYDLQWD